MRRSKILSKITTANVIVRLKISCAHATAVPGSPEKSTTFAANHPRNGRNSATPNVLKQRFANATCRAVFCILMLATSAVAVVPIFAPMTMGIAAVAGRIAC
ncbi:MAG TPA: hypothetical protein VMG82_03470 [Candidatus Sulfotelmatobacter sp.]|nr:hypothetical protein [Candidatus Sulfotelmatobacter sp.]